MAIDGNYAIVGALYNDDHGTSSGSAYIFNVQTGAERYKLLPMDARIATEFGCSVAISGNYAIVGARYEDEPPRNNAISNYGSAYIFNVLTGAQLHKLILSDKEAYDYFGWSVAISGNYAMVGAWSDDGNNGQNSGRVHLYNVQTGAHIKEITASDVAASDNFSRGTIAMSGNYAIVGAYGDDDNGSDSGSAYIFGPTALLPPLLSIDNDSTNMVVNGTIVAESISTDKIYATGNMGSSSMNTKKAQIGTGDFDDEETYSDFKNIVEQTLIPNDSLATGDEYGRDVAVSGNYVIVSNDRDDDNGSNSGSVYIFDATTGAQIHKLLPSDGAASDYFGNSVAISGNYAIVGAKFDDDTDSNTGSAYIFNVTTGLQIYKLVASDAAQSDYFGYSVAIDGNYAIVGAQYDDSQTGSA